MLGVTTVNYQPHLQLLRLPEVMRRTGMGRSFIYRAASEGSFPQFRKCGRATVWSAREVEQWIAARLAGEPVVASEA